MRWFIYFLFRFEHILLFIDFDIENWHIETVKNLILLVFLENNKLKKILYLLVSVSWSYTFWNTERIFPQIFHDNIWASIKF